MSRLLTPIGHCSKKLRRKLEIEEEEALAWRVKVRRSKVDDEPVGGGKGGRWHLAANLSVPGPFGDRPVSPDGHVSFHYGITTVSKSSSGKSVVADSRGKVSETDRSPGDHDKYVARDGAVMTIGPAEFDRYAARDNVTDLVTGNPEVALMSNISLDPAVRATFWNAVHAMARNAGPDRLILDPSRGTKKEWSALAAAEDVPTDLRQAAAQFASGERKRKAEFPMTAAEAKDTIELICRFIPHADRKKGPVRFARGRKGRTQYRLETELPDGIDDAARVRIMIRVAEEVEATGAMYTLALHRPDEHNDARNYHLHLVAHDRPAKLIDGEWDFTIATDVEGQSGRKKFADRKKKVVVESLKTASNRGDFEAFLKDFRGRYADLCNEELRAADQERFFDPRRYTEMGIDRKPTKPLGSRLAPLEAAGVPTKVGTANAEIIWTYELQTRLRRCDAERAQRDQTVADLRATVDRLAPADPEREPTGAAFDRAVQAATLLAVVEPELAEYEVTLAMARARPAKVVDTCSRILREVEAGGGSSTDRRNRSRIKDRLDEAAVFLHDIERIDRANQKVIAGQRPMIDQAHRDIAAAAEIVASLEARSPLASQTWPEPVFSSAPVVGDDMAPSSEPVNTAAPAQASEEAAASSNAVKAGPTEAASPQLSRSATLEVVITRIKTDRLIVLGPEHHDGEGYRVGGVTRDELHVLRHPDVAARAQAELARVAKHQADEIEGAHLIYRSHGRARAEEMAASSSGHPSPTNNPLGVLRAYRDHPRAAALMGWEVPEPVQSTEKRPSIWRRMRASVADALSSPELPKVDAQPEPPATDAAASWSPRPLGTEPFKAGPSLEDAVAEYAEVIRTSADVHFILVDGERRVDPSSIPDWKRSVHAFEDHDFVKTAIRDRWEEEQEKAQRAERQRAGSEKFRAGKRARILAGLDAGELVASRGKNGWIVAGRDQDLVFFANRWSDHPQLAAAFQKSQTRGLSAGRPLTVRHAPPNLQSVVRQSALPAVAQSAGPANVSTSRSQAPAQGYTLGEQQWMRDRQSGRGGP